MIQQMCRKRVAQRMRRYLPAVDAGSVSIALEIVPKRLTRHRSTSCGGKYCLRRSTFRQLRSRLREVSLHPRYRFFTQGHEAFLVALAHHAHKTLHESELRMRQTDELGYA